MTPEHNPGNLRRAILGSVHWPKDTPRTRSTEAQRIFDLAIPMFAYPDKKVAQRLLEGEYGDKVGLSGEKIYDELKKLAIRCWEEMTVEDRRPYGASGPKTVEKIKRSLR